MVFISVEDFLEKAGGCRRLTRREEVELALRMKAGDPAARQRIIESYLPMVAGDIGGKKGEYQTLGLVYACLQALGKAVDTFDFLQEGETFAHRLSWWLRQTTVAYIADRRK